MIPTEVFTAIGMVVWMVAAIGLFCVGATLHYGVDGWEAFGRFTLGAIGLAMGLTLLFTWAGTP